MVDSVTVCAGTGRGGAVKVKVDGLTVRVDGGAVTFNVTEISTAMAATVASTVAV